MDITKWLIKRVDGTYGQRNWAGKGVLPAVKGVTVKETHWRPHPNQHSVAEIVLHIAYWKDAVTSGLTGKPWKYSEEMNWRTVPPTDRGWKEAQAELQAAHRRLMRSLRGLKPARLMQPLAPRRRVRVADLVIDIATHDTYHAAQIFVLRHLYAARK